MKTTESTYEKQATDFLTKTGTELSVVFKIHDKHFPDDTDKRDIYTITLKRGQRKYSFDFGNSLNNSGKYIGHKNLCMNKFGKYLFTEDEFRKLKYDAKYHEIKLNPKFEEPTAYSVLACLQKYDVGTLENFCSEFGYDTDSKKAEKTYKAVVEEYKNVCTLFSDKELEELQEIQ